jgi:hypothetical protein
VAQSFSFSQLFMVLPRLQCGLYSELLMSVGIKGLRYHHKVLVLAHEEATVRVVDLLAVTCHCVGSILQWEWTSECILYGRTSAPFFFLGVGAIGIGKHLECASFLSSQCGIPTD